MANGHNPMVPNLQEGIAPLHRYVAWRKRAQLAAASSGACRGFKHTYKFKQQD